jgi:alpha-tubulin suppressor-like RCC1 family protein
MPPSSCARVASLIVGLAALWAAAGGNLHAKPAGRVSAGQGTTFFVTSAGDLYGCGRNERGQLGDGSVTQRTSAVLIDSQVQLVSAPTYGEAMFYLKTDGTLWGTGRNAGGLLGPDTLVYLSRPTQIARNVRDFSTGPGTLLYITTDGTLWGLGDNRTGALGTGDTNPARTPVRIAGGVNRADTNGTSTFYWTVSGQFWAMGRNDFGNLGDGTLTRRLAPVRIEPGAGTFSVGNNSTWSINTQGELHSWGDGGVAGDPATGGHTAAPVLHSRGYRSVEATDIGAWALRENGELWSLGQRTWSGEKVAEGVTDFSAGASHQIFVDADGRIWTGGSNANGELGLGNTNASRGAGHYSPIGFLSRPGDMAPADIRGRPLRIVIDDGTGVFGSSGSYRLVPAATGATYTVTPLSSSIVPSSGTYSYARSSGTTATLEIRDSVTGGSTSSRLEFISSNAANYRLESPQGTQAGRAFFETPAVITAQPRGATLPLTRTNFVISVAATGAPTLRYQWYRDGSSLNGLTSSGIVLTSLTAASDGARYSVEIANDFGGIRTAEAVVRVLAPPATSQVRTAPLRVSAAVGARAVLAPTVTGGGTLRYQWRRLGRPLAGAEGPQLELAAVSAADAGLYQLDGINEVGATQAWVELNLIAPPVITTPPRSQTVLLGSRLELTVAASSATPLTYQWLRNGTTLTGATGATYAVAATVAATAGDYTVRVTNRDGSTLSPVARVELATAPSITAAPASGAPAAGANFSLTVTAGGTPPLSYQWRRNGIDLPGETAARLDLPAFSEAQTGRYAVTVSSPWGRVTSTEATVQVGQPPTLTRAPSTLTAPNISAAGLASASFSVTASGTGPLAYQWFRDGAPITGGTAATLTYNAVSTIYAANFWVEVANTAGTARSSPVKLNIGQASLLPVIRRQPASVTAAAGTALTLSVDALAAEGAPPASRTLRYTWRRNGMDIFGSSGPTLAISAPAAGTIDRYVVRVSDAGSPPNAVASDVAEVSSAPASALANLSVRTALGAGETLILGAVVGGSAKEILVRAAGPALRQFGLEGMADPGLELHGSAGILAANDDWPGSLTPVAAAVGAFPFAAGSRDAGVSRSLQGAFTVQARGNSGGVVLVEAYDVTGGTLSRLVNLSARNRVGTGDDILIAGFALSGTGTRQILIRGIGPRLAAFGVGSPLRDPRLEVFDSGGRSVAVNDNWNVALEPTFARVGAFGLTAGSLDAALIATLTAGRTYTVQLSGADGGTGEGLIELYEVP